MTAQPRADPAFECLVQAAASEAQIRPHRQGSVSSTGQRVRHEGYRRRFPPAPGGNGHVATLEPSPDGCPRLLRAAGRGGLRTSGRRHCALHPRPGRRLCADPREVRRIGRDRGPAALGPPALGRRRRRQSSRATPARPSGPLRGLPVWRQRYPGVGASRSRECITGACAASGATSPVSRLTRWPMTMIWPTQKKNVSSRGRARRRAALPLLEVDRR